jgi:hypothetical protein
VTACRVRDQLLLMGEIGFVRNGSSGTGGRVNFPEQTAKTVSEPDTALPVTFTHRLAVNESEPNNAAMRAFP